MKQIDMIAQRLEVVMTGDRELQVIVVDCCDKMNYFELEGYKVVHKDQLAKEILDITGWGLIK